MEIKPVGRRASHDDKPKKASASACRESHCE